jgi:hypothetical protein
MFYKTLCVCVCVRITTETYVYNGFIANVVNDEVRVCVCVSFAHTPFIYVLRNVLKTLVSCTRAHMEHLKWETHTHKLQHIMHQSNIDECWSCARVAHPTKPVRTACALNNCFVALDGHTILSQLLLMSVCELRVVCICKSAENVNTCTILFVRVCFSLNACHYDNCCTLSHVRCIVRGDLKCC